MTRPLTSLIALMAVVLMAMLAGCGGAGDAPSTGSEAAKGRPEAQVPFATATAEPTQAGRPQIRTSLQGSCRLTPTGADIVVEYSVFATGSAVLTRVRLLEDGSQVEDSGTIEQRQYRRTSVFRVDAGDQRTYRLAAESSAGSAANVQSTVRCGISATPSPAPRV